MLRSLPDRPEQEPETGTPRRDAWCRFDRGSSTRWTGSSRSGWGRARSPRLPTFGVRELATLLVRNLDSKVAKHRKSHKGPTDHRGAFSPGISSVPLWWGVTIAATSIQI